MLILPLKSCILYLKGKQYAGTEFHNVALHGKKLLVTFVPKHVLQMLTSQKHKLCTGVEKSCTCIWHTQDITTMLTLKKLSKTLTFLSFACGVYKK